MNCNTLCGVGTQTCFQKKMENNFLMFCKFFQTIATFSSNSKANIFCCLLFKIRNIFSARIKWMEKKLFSQQASNADWDYLKVLLNFIYLSANHLLFSIVVINFVYLLLRWKLNILFSIAACEWLKAFE